ncbi:hypothetical protein [Rufibacter psychrotolerans]|nr:hypothetical protein [Rufibacter sp. SYSU D00308]
MMVHPKHGKSWRPPSAASVSGRKQAKWWSARPRQPGPAKQVARKRTSTP